MDGAWCRAFDMDLKEAYAAPHDVGWAAYACETGWTVSEILMGMMMPDILKKGNRILIKTVTFHKRKSDRFLDEGIILLSKESAAALAREDEW